MIGSLKGEIIHKGPSKIEINTNGIGWEVYLSQNDLDKINIKDKAEVFTYHHVAEKTNSLYGFLSRQDKQVFEMLLAVNGVGPKTALEVFSTGSGEKILRAITEADVDFFCRVKGLGKKGSQRIIVDLKTKAGGIKDLDLKGESTNKTVCQALRSLGFSREETRTVLRKIPSDIKTEEDKIKFALKQFGKK